MAFSFAPTYQDYLSYYGKGGDGALSQDQWNALGTAGQWNNIGGGLALDPSDPRYAAIAQQLGMAQGLKGSDALINLGYKPQSIAINGQNYVDPSKVLQGDDVFATAHSNETPKTQFAGGGLSDKGWVLAALSVLGGGAALGTALGGAAAGAGGAAGVTGSSALTTGGFGTDIGLGSGTFAGAAGGAAGGVAGTSGGGFDANGVWHDIPQMDPVQAPTLNPMGPDATPLGSNGSSFLRQLNTGRQYFNGARSVMNLLSGGQGRSGSTGMAGSNSDWLSGLLGLLAGGHQAFGNGIGTAAGAQANAQHASEIADPWGSSGNRGRFMDLLTPDRFMALTSQDPSAVLNNPAYQFELNQGIGAINQGDAAQGTLRSGNRGLELEKYGQGLAAKYGQQYFDNNMKTLSALSNLAGVNAGSPQASAASLVNGFDNASNLRNAGTNSFFSGGSSNPLLSLLSSGGSGLSGILSSIFGGDSSGFDMSTVDFGNLPAFNDVSGFNPGDFFTEDPGSLADATGAFF